MATSQVIILLCHATPVIFTGKLQRKKFNEKSGEWRHGTSSAFAGEIAVESSKY
jgi:hypothetical protein